MTAKYILCLVLGTYVVFAHAAEEQERTFWSAFIQRYRRTMILQPNSLRAANTAIFAALSGGVFLYTTFAKGEPSSFALTAAVTFGFLLLRERDLFAWRTILEGTPSTSSTPTSRPSTELRRLPSTGSPEIEESSSPLLAPAVPIITYDTASNKHKKHYGRSSI